MISINLTEDIHDSDFFTFETSWIGEEIYNLETNEIRLPVLNLEVLNLEVIEQLGINSCNRIYVRESFFTFKGVYKLEKKLRIQKKGKFLAGVSTVFEFENTEAIEKTFELGGMGVYGKNIYDGVFRIYASECLFSVHDNSPVSLEFISMDEYDPVNDKWLTGFENFVTLMK